MPTSGSLNYDASITNEKRSVRIYKDLNLNFNTNVVTKDIAKLTDLKIKRISKYDLDKAKEFRVASRRFYGAPASGSKARFDKRHNEVIEYVFDKSKNNFKK